jgi:hypothetical protein
MVAAAPFAMATAPIMKEAQAKNPALNKCTACHAAMPCTKLNLNDEGKKWVKK